MSLRIARWLKAPGLLLVVLCMVVPSLASSSAGSLASVDIGDTSEYFPVFLHLASGSFDPLVTPELARYPAQLVLASYPGDGLGYYIVQLDGPITTERKGALTSQGAQIFDYLPDYAFVVRMDHAIRAKVEQLPAVRWVGLYQPAYRVAPSLQTQELLERGQDWTAIQELNVLTFPGHQEQIATQLRELGAEVLGKSQTARTGKLRIRVKLDEIGAIAAFDGVRWIEAAPEWRLYNNVATDLMNARDVWDVHGLYGKGQTVAVSDTGLDQGSTLPASLHDDFEDGNGNSRVVAIIDRVGDGAGDVNSGHGTHVAGSVLGNGARSGATPSNHLYPSSAYVGLAPEASLVFQAVENNTTGELSGIPWDLNELFAEAQAAGASIHSDSWGADVDGEYTSDSEAVDEYVWNNPDFTILFASGNDGEDADKNGIVDMGSVGSPATAKNCIAVGASENERPTIANTYGDHWPSDFPVNPIFDDRVANAPSGMVAFSSRGPADDGRYKPDVVAPGTFIASVRSSAASESGWGAINSDYMFNGGTSMATPLAAGAAALVRGFYTDEAGITPSAALIKATLVNGAQSLSPGQYGTGSTQEIPDPPRPNNVEGWGRVNLENSIFQQAPRTLRYTDHVTGLMTSEVATFVYQVTGSAEPLRMTLVWSDYPASPAAGGLVNDLDLIVTSPNGTAHHPTGAQQRPGTESVSLMADNVNNVEGVDISTPELGAYTVQVRGANVTMGGRQPFALVVSGQVVDEPHKVIGIEPDHAPNNATLRDAVVSGTGFEQGAQVHLVSNSDVITGAISAVDLVADPDTITADFDLNGATPGWWDVRVTNSPVTSATLENAFFAVDATLPNLGVATSAVGGDAYEAEPGSWLTFTISIQNSGFVSATGVVFTDTLPDDVTFERLNPDCVGGTLALPGDNGFACELAGGPMAAGVEITYTLVVSVSQDAAGVLTNRVEVGSTEADGYIYDNSAQGSARVKQKKTYLPLLARGWPPVPTVPTLNPISDGLGGSYTVSWSVVDAATAYLLQEAADASFIGATPVYTGSGQSKSFTGKSDGTYYYRVRAQNQYGTSAWSNTQSVVVSTIPGGIANGDFENGRDGSWTESSSHGFALIVSSELPVDAHSGSWSAWLGGYTDETSTLSQAVTIPTGGSVLSFWYWIGSEDFCGYDFGQVIIGSAPVDVFDLCENTNTNGWVRRTVDLSAYVGQTVSLQIGAETDSTFNSNLFVDDVVLGSSSLALESQDHALPARVELHSSDSAMPRH